MKIKRYHYNAKLFLSIVNDHSCPVDPYISAYVNQLSASVSFNTALRSANELLFILRHFAVKKIDLISRVICGRLISEHEYMQFYDRCCLNAEWVEDAQVVPVCNVRGKAFRNMLSANSRVTARVSAMTLQGRLRRMRKFIEWLSEQFQETFDAVLPAHKLDKLKSIIRMDELGLKRRVLHKKDQLESVIPNDVFNHLERIIKPSAPDNPFMRSRLRNFLIVSIFMESGIRRGALAKAKISDFHFSQDYDTFSVYRSGHDATDPRLDRPNQKTRAHFATISSALMRSIKHYIDTVRADLPASCFHDFVFVSETNAKGTLGNPISLKSINAIFERLSKSLKFRVHPHLLRHKWNEIYDEKGVRSGLDYRLIEDTRKYAMGWAQNTTMSEVYNNKRLATKAREISKCYQKRIDGL